MFNIKDSYNMGSEANRRFAKHNIDKLIHVESRFEGVNTTLPQTKTIIDGMGVSGVPTKDITTITNLKRGWDEVINNDNKITFDFVKNINAIVAADDAIFPGEIRTGASGIDIGNDEYIDSEIPNEEDEKKYFNDILGSDLSTTEKALTIMYHNFKQQLFWDGNKRTSVLVANKIMIEGGAGLINIPLNKIEEWNNKISDFYRTNEVSSLIHWTEKNGINGIDTDRLKKDMNKQKTKNNQINSL